MSVRCFRLLLVAICERGFKREMKKKDGVEIDRRRQTMLESDIQENFGGNKRGKLEKQGKKLEIIMLRLKICRKVLQCRSMKRCWSDTQSISQVPPSSSFGSGRVP